MIEIQETLRTNLKKYRGRLGYSQMKLAELCGVSTSYIGELEIGRKFPSAKTFQKLADSLQVKPYMLLLESSDIEAQNREQALYSFTEELTETLQGNLRETLQKYLKKS